MSIRKWPAAFFCCCSFLGSTVAACADYAYYNCIVAEKKKENLRAIRKRLARYDLT